VASTFGSSRAVGVQKLAVAFDSLAKAPGNGYNYDSVTVVSPGDAVVVQASTTYCSLQLTSLLYSKYIIDSVDAGTRQVYLRAVVDPNCGFRSFRAGVPRN
jgi:hypothetical protein